MLSDVDASRPRSYLEFGVDRQRFDDLKLRPLVHASSDHINIIHVRRRL